MFCLRYRFGNKTKLFVHIALVTSSKCMCVCLILFTKKNCKSWPFWFCCYADGDGIRLAKFKAKLRANKITDTVRRNKREESEFVIVQSDSENIFCIWFTFIHCSQFLHVRILQFHSNYTNSVCVRSFDILLLLIYVRIFSKDFAHTRAKSEHWKVS